MSTKSEAYDRWYSQGYRAGYAAAQADLKTGIPKTQQQFYDLTPHDLDTMAMGIALVVLHADSIQTIEATMETQQKLGLAEKVLGTLHLIATQCGLYHPFVPLHETDPNPWLDLGISPNSYASEREPYEEKPMHPRDYPDYQEAPDVRDT